MNIYYVEMSNGKSYYVVAEDLTDLQIKLNQRHDDYSDYPVAKQVNCLNEGNGTSTEVLT